MTILKEPTILIEGFGKKFGAEATLEFGKHNWLSDNKIRVNYGLAIKTRLRYNPTDFTFGAFENRLKFSPEFIRDINDIYKFSFNDCLQCSQMKKLIYVFE